jgi:hypothetical protein
MVLFLFDNVIYVFLLLWICILTVCLCMTTLTEVFPCFFLSCKANARVKPQRWGTARTLPNFCVVLCIVCFVSFSVLFVCICVLYYCHRVATQLPLNMSYYHIIYQSSRSSWKQRLSPKYIRLWLYTSSYAVRQSKFHRVENIKSYPQKNHHYHHRHICHGVGLLVGPFRSHVSRSLFRGLPWFLLPVGE